MIIGPSETPYFSGYYFFELNYPVDYPHSPPKVKYLTNGNNVRFNPNLYKCGKVCISLLNTWRGEQWTSCQTISSVLLTLCTLLCKDPLLNEPCVTKTHNDFKNYTTIIEYSNIDVAICDIIRKKKGVYMELFESFYPFIKDNFLQNYTKLAEFVENKIATTFKTPTILKTGLYDMTIEIDYLKVLNKLKECKDTL